MLEAGEIATIAPLVKRLRDSINAVVLGKPEVTDLALIGFLARGHLLIEDVPGVGKTTLARALARCVDCSFHRLQFTPDLLPSDIIGTSVFHAASGEFHFKKGPLFANVVLCDEINRTSPRTQSALLEAMNEGQVSVDGVTHSLGSPFLVLATQNPFEFEGTFPLPENQLDRFLLRIEMGYPPRESERLLLEDHRSGEPIDHMRSVASVKELLYLQDQARAVKVAPAISDYILDLVHATRESPDVLLGVSTRGALMLYRATQAHALLAGRMYAVPDDVKATALPTLTHRIIPKSMANNFTRKTSRSILEGILNQAKAPA